MYAYISLLICLGYLLSQISYRKGYKEGYAARASHYVCAECESLDSCKNPDGVDGYCKWEP